MDPTQALHELWDDLRRPDQRRQFLVLFEVVATVSRTGPRPRLAGTLVGRLLEALAAELRTQRPDRIRGNDDRDARSCHHPGSSAGPRGHR
ncbi:MAG: hypothetical protein R2705_17695 [Ilumatobacteraceae bacterium]